MKGNERRRNACSGEEWSVRSPTKRQILTRLDVTKKGAEPGRSRTRKSQVKTLQTIPKGIDPFAEWTLAWTNWQPYESEAEIWFKPDTVLLVKETMNEDGTTKIKLRPVAPLETPMKLVVSIAVGQAADHMVTSMQKGGVQSDGRS